MRIDGGCQVGRRAETGRAPGEGRFRDAEGKRAHDIGAGGPAPRPDPIGSGEGNAREHKTRSALSALSSKRGNPLESGEEAAGMPDATMVPIVRAERVTQGQ